MKRGVLPGRPVRMGDVRKDMSFSRIGCEAVSEKLNQDAVHVRPESGKALAGGMVCALEKYIS